MAIGDFFLVPLQIFALKGAQDDCRIAGCVGDTLSQQ
jgi:hypothetical protein